MQAKRSSDFGQLACAAQLTCQSMGGRTASSDRAFYLPSYSPQLNPEERLNADLKQQMCKRVPVRTKLKLREAANQHMTMLEQNPERVMSYFQDRRVRYAA